MMAEDSVAKSCQPNEKAWIHVLQYLLLYATTLMQKLDINFIVPIYEYVPHITRTNINYNTMVELL